MLKRLLAGLLFGMGIVSFLGWWQWQRIRKNRLSAPLASSLIRHPDSDIILQRNGDTLSVRWAKQTSKADIFLSEAFSENIPPQAVTTVENQQLAILHGIDTQKRYQVTVKCEDGTELRQIERVLSFESVPNFRDIGGYFTKNGCTVRWNRVYRASALDNLSQQDSERLRDLDVKLVCDVRTREEQITNPDNLPDNIRLISTAPSSDDSVLRTVFRLLLQAGFLENLLLDLYQRVMVDDNPQVFARIFQELSQEDNLPMVIHCAAGKDRTGISIALLLSLLGVPDETIVADYTLSNHHHEFFRASTRKNLAQLKLIGLSEADFDHLLVADGRLMQETLDYVRQKYGSVENYFHSYLGLSAETLNAIRYNLLD